MVGNVESDYRIDGWSNGEWFEANNVSISGDHPFIQSPASLTMNLVDGSLSGKRDVNARLGFICQGESGVGQGDGKTCGQKSGKDDHVGNKPTTVG